MISAASTKVVITAPSAGAVSLSSRRAVSHVSRTRRCKLSTTHKRVVRCSVSPEESSNPGESRLLRTIATNGEVVVTLAKTTSVVNDSIQRHQTSPTVGGALGRGLTAVMLMASFRGEGEQVQVTFKGSGPIGNMTVMSTHLGEVRGMVSNPQAQVPLKPDGTLDVGSAIGPGTLQVVRSLPMLEPYTGIVPITNGEVAEDLAVYLRDSEQQNTALGVGVSIEPDGTCGAAGGFFVQSLPFTGDDTVEMLERNIGKLPPITEMISNGVPLEDITSMILEGIGCSPGAEVKTPVYGPCGAVHLRPRMLKAVASIPPNEILETIDEVGSMEVTCEFCKETIQFSKEDLTQLLV
uniref:Uncharacterized protein n=1 Tax=Pyramimonas obovata TaxID=1411642 RepID=A0A7S0WSZ3_9CHLO|mmetsp:Transcript_38738/g.84279  ORF Transcript_38738/g.84279 Transcript_38738/m.84279 type:complete len:351 (+) Transcript_38738:135-1187(+)|eukprot:CAMPEP_0118925964 /NCGR_PEP_ID=MMETSP1169-20130426/3765_1 /TAXON_ID=36882 /ORGANISM="Pyramimonas obovata, Strain CCMP722" /LENGTH=350 /DNA_ID=CAMNT_0006867413 /DNA_START=65 /DNA_END=1117 /DNA_ORIENTATION=-